MSDTRAIKKMNRQYLGSIESYGSVLWHAMTSGLEYLVDAYANPLLSITVHSLVHLASDSRFVPLDLPFDDFFKTTSSKEEHSTLL